MPIWSLQNNSRKLSSFIFRHWQENIILHHPPTKLISAKKPLISSKLGTSSYFKQQKLKINSTKTNKQNQAYENNTYQHKVKLTSNILSNSVLWRIFKLIIITKKPSKRCCTITDYHLSNIYIISNTTKVFY